MDLGLVRKVDIDKEMQQSYLDYAMSVIVARALPDARDGLKPVQRRILYAMHDMGINPGSAFKKSARIVGEVLGKYHPHGDVAVYEAMARLAQDFSVRYLLVDGQGNFGSIDGDPPAAMRYTEARLARFSGELMAQIDRNTVDFVDNFDGTLQEPEVLPAAVPNLLVNGASGIAVGMATNIPPHNLSEVTDALSFMLEEWDHLDEISVHDLMRFVKGPDFPTGGIILQSGPENALEAAYGSGKGRISVRGRVHAEDMGRGRSRLIISELPYQTNKTTLIERIAELVRDGHLENISDLRDESDRQGMRIVIEINKSSETEKVLRELYHRTPLQSTFGISLLALVDGEPRMLTLKQALRVFIEHRLTVVRRRSEYDLAKARARAHILEGLLVALKHLDEIIKIIRNSPDVEQARERLIKRFSLSDLQAQAILDMQLRRLASLERKKIEEEYKELITTIKDLEALLKDPKRMRPVVEQELKDMKQVYGDRRRTQIVSLKEGDSAASLLTADDLTPAQAVWVGVTADGKIARTHSDDLPRVAGQGAPRFLLRTSTRHTLYLSNEQGQASAVAVNALPDGEGFEEGVPLYKASALAPEDRLAAMFSIPPQNEVGPDRYVVSVTRQGMVKKTAISELAGPSSQKFVLVKVNAEDSLLDLILTDGKSEIGMITEQGMAIRFNEDEVRPMGLAAAGVMGMKLAAGDAVTAALRWNSKADVLLAAADGTGWRISASDFPLQGRYGQGVIACRLVKGNRLMAAFSGGRGESGLLHFAQAGSRTVKAGDLTVAKRGSKGAPLAALRSGDSIAGISPVRDGLEFWGEKRKSPAAEEKPESPTARASRKAAAQAKETERMAVEQLTLLDAPAEGSAPTRKPRTAAPAAERKAKAAPASEAPEKGRAGKAAQQPSLAITTPPAAAEKKIPAKKAAAPTAPAEKPGPAAFHAAKKPAEVRAKKGGTEPPPAPKNPAGRNPAVPAPAEKKPSTPPPAKKNPAVPSPAEKNPAVKKPRGK